MKDATVTRLTGDGWKVWPNSFKPNSTCFCKRFDTETRCHGNDDKPGMQIELAISERDGVESFELSLCAGLKDETWLELLNYSLPKDVEKVLALIPRMLRIWEAAQ